MRIPLQPVFVKIGRSFGTVGLRVCGMVYQHVEDQKIRFFFLIYSYYYLSGCNPGELWACEGLGGAK